jgi:hypothetical protein
MKFPTENYPKSTKSHAANVKVMSLTYPRAHYPEQSLPPFSIYQHSPLPPFPHLAAPAATRLNTPFGIPQVMPIFSLKLPLAFHICLRSIAIVSSLPLLPTKPELSGLFMYIFSFPFPYPFTFWLFE